MACKYLHSDWLVPRADACNLLGWTLRQYERHLNTLVMGGLVHTERHFHPIKEKRAVSAWVIPTPKTAEFFGVLDDPLKEYWSGTTERWERNTTDREQLGTTERWESSIYKEITASIVLSPDGEQEHFEQEIQTGRFSREVDREKETQRKSLENVKDGETFSI